MKVLQINGYELPGARFHGLSITPLLKEHGIDSKHFCWIKDSNNPDVVTFDKWSKKKNLFVRAVEEVTSLQSVLYNNAKKIVELPEFKEADLIHLHIIHSGFFSIGDLELITKLKPTVWTLHDPWALTGHCIHPGHCERWKIGCGSCPDLKKLKPLLFDTTKFLFNYKKKAYSRSKFELIVASDWMKRLVNNSPIFDNSVIVNHVPFGLDLDLFNKKSAVDLRKKFSIPDESIIISFRSDAKEFKGTPYIIEALKKLKSDKKICIITIGKMALSHVIGNDFQVIDLGWINDDKLLRDVLSISDIFLMPSLGESFGMMAIEAMACSTPVIVFENTALPGVTFAPDVGLSVENKNSTALSEAIAHLIDSPKEREKRGIESRKKAELHYNEKKHVESIVKIYQDLLSR